MSLMREYFKDELYKAEFDSTIVDSLLAMLEASNVGEHSGSSWQFLLETFRRLASFKPLSPLTGAEDEWVEVAENLEQNKRCPTVFRKNKNNGYAYDIATFVYTRDNGKTWVRIPSDQKLIEFPYSVPDEPTKIYLKGDE